MVSEPVPDTLDRPRYQTRAQAHSQEMEQQMAELTRVILAQSESIKVLQDKTEAIHATMEEIKPAVFELQRWKPEMESTVEGLRTEMGELRSQVTHIARNPVLTLRPVDLPPILPRPETHLESKTESSNLPSDQETIPTTRKDSVLGSVGYQEEFDQRGRTTGGRSLSAPLSGIGKTEHLELSTHGGDVARH